MTLMTLSWYGSEAEIRRSGYKDQFSTQNLRRRRLPRALLQNEVEEDINTLRQKQNLATDDVHLWIRRSGYKNQFSTQ